MVRDVRQLEAAATLLCRLGVADAVLRRLEAWLEAEAGDGKVQQEDMTSMLSEAREQEKKHVTELLQ